MVLFYLLVNHILKEGISLNPNLKKAYALHTDLASLRESMEKSNDVLLETMKLSEFNAYLKQYLDIVSDIAITLKDETSAKANALSCVVRDGISKTRKLLVANLGRILYAHDNTAFSATAAEELDAVTKSAEEAFNSEVAKATDYFGSSFLKSRLVQGIGISTLFLPKTIEDMLASPKRWQWQTHTIVNGFPKPIYLDLYREALPRIIDQQIRKMEAKSEKKKLSK